MITKALVEKALDGGLPSLKDFFDKLPKEDAIKGLGILVILGVSKIAIDTVKEIVLKKVA